MRRRQFFGGLLSALSITSALALLVALLLVATAGTPDSYRHINQHTTYLAQSLEAVERAITQAQSDAAVAEGLLTLEQGLQQARAELADLIEQTYAPESLADQIRWPLMEFMNYMDVDASELTGADPLLVMYQRLSTQLVRVERQLSKLAKTQSELALQTGAYRESARDIVLQLREDQQLKTADAVYNHTEKLANLIEQGGAVDLESGLTMISGLEKVEDNVVPAMRGQLRALIDQAYVITSQRRTANQAIARMDLAATQAFVGRFAQTVTQDQLYVLAVVSDARILLNIYTVLLLCVLAYFGLRLSMSHRALNRSHDDLEQRVRARTADLAQANEDLKESQVQLVQAEKMSSLGQLVAGVMHEINTPLLYVLNNTTITADTVGELRSFFNATLPILEAHSADEGKLAVKRFLNQRDQFDVAELSEGLDEISSLAQDSVDGLNQISELVQSLKDFSRLDRVADESFDVREGIEKTLTITRNLLKYGVEVETDFGEVPEIHCSPARLNQVFINIVTNAVQAMDGEGKLNIKTSFVPNERGDSVEIIFSDTGCGIAEEHLTKIMDPFFTTKPVGEGTGLGLSIVAQIIEQHHGQILVDSKVGQGTRITLSLPVDATPVAGDPEHSGPDGPHDPESGSAGPGNSEEAA